MHKFILTIFILIIGVNIQAQSDKSTYKKLDKALELIETKYIDTVNSADLATKAVQAMIKELDPHSKYLSPDDLKTNRESLNGSFAGIGIHYQIINDTLMILNTVKGGPSYKAGLKAGDRILKIDGEIATGKDISNKYFSKKLRGKKGEELSITIKNHKNSKVRKITFERGSIALNTVEISYMIDDKTGFIRIKSFSRTTNYEFQLAVMQLQMEGMKNIIIDLRDNPGGLMMSSIRLSDDFLSNDKLIVYTQGTNLPRTDYKSNGGGMMESGRVVILIDNNSASAAEIFAGALQDWDRALIVGRRSFGKGLVGRNYDLPDGSAIRLTTGRYYTPSGRCIQKEYTKGDKKSYDNDLLERFEHGELYSADSVHFDDSLKYYTNGKRLVYGGGAIMPDIFIPLDTTYNNDFIKDTRKKGLINYFAGNYFDKNLDELNAKYPSFESFNTTFVLPEETYQNYIDYAAKKYELTPNEEDKELINHYIRLQITAILARSLYKDGAYYKIYNKEDKMVINALNTINNKKIFKNNGIQ